MEYKEYDQNEDQLAKCFAVEVSAEEARGIVDEIYAFLAMQSGADFLGSDPRDALEKRFGDDLGQRVAACLANQCADKIILLEGLAAALEPEVAELPDIDGVDFCSPISFTVKIFLKPTLSLSSYEPVEIALSEPIVSDEMIDNEIDSLVKSKARYVIDELAEVVTNRTMNVISVDTKKFGMQVDALTASNAKHQIGDGLFPDEIDEQLLGMKCGEAKKFNFTITSKNFLGMDVEEKMDCLLKVVSIVRKEIPQVDDSWVRDNVPGAHDMDGFRALVGSSIKERFESNYRRVKEESAVSALARRLPDLDIPDSYYDYARAGLLQNISTALSRQGITEDEFLAAQGLTAPQFMAQMHMRAAEILKQGLALDAYALRKGIKPTDSDMEHALKNIAWGKEDQTRKMLEMNGRMYQLREMALRLSVRSHIAATAVLRPAAL